jgi:anti-sigma factor RsiW
MNCERYQNWAALAASGDLAIRERRSLEEHVQTCEECRLCVAEFAALSNDLAALRDPEIDPAVYAAIRRNVRTRLPDVRPRVIPGWLTWPAAAVAIALLILLLRHPTPPLPVVVATRPPAVPPSPARVVPAIETVRKHTSVRKHRVRLAKKEEPAQPLVVKMLTDDPNVVIIWLVDKQGE